MTVLGIGVDVLDLDSFARDLDAPGTRFAAVFSPTERRQSRERSGAAGHPGDHARHLGVRWAAKEAVVKAWSTALYGSPPVIAPGELHWPEIETVCDAWGRPTIRLSGVAATEVARTVGPAAWHVSLSHDGVVATAFVVLESAR